jgi:hypothetical protein
MELKIETVEQLENWMIENKYKKHSYIIGNYFFTTEGCGIDNNGGLFSWFFTERGERKVLKYFVNEKEAVAYALKKISENEH